MIGIIALLVSILLPTLSRARQQAAQIKCMSNLRQLGMAFQMYTGDNKGRYPFDAPYGGLGPRDEDWIWWQETPVAAGAVAGSPGRPNAPDPEESAIAKYVGHFNIGVFLCPIDDPMQRQSSGGAALGGYYRYSYSMNVKLSGSTSTSPRIAQIRNSTEKVLLVEETELTINDGHWSAPQCDDTGAPYPAGSTDPLNHDLLAIRHDRKGVSDSVAIGAPMPNADRRGNAAFVDGHAEYATRVYIHYHGHLNPYE